MRATDARSVTIVLRWLTQRPPATGLHAEAVLLPAALRETEVTWAVRGSNHTVVMFDAHGEHSELGLEMSPKRAVLSCCLSRWDRR